MANEQVMTTLAEKLVAKRAGRGIRITAKEIGVSAATLSRVENGNVPDLETFRKICTWLGVDPGTILGISQTKPALEVRVHFRKKNAVDTKTAAALAEMILHAQRAMQEADNI